MVTPGNFNSYIHCAFHFIEQANLYHPTIKFTAEVSQSETTFLDTTVYKGERFEKESILDVRTHYKPTETFQYTNYYSYHPAGVKKGFVKGEAPEDKFF